jgi:hypothetical protein
MFILLDESFGSQFTVVGCLCIPLSLLPRQEENFVNNRIKNNCWGELGWGGVSEEYIGKYIDFLQGYLEPEEITFHSWAYKNPGKEFRGDPNKLLHTHEYTLLKNTLIKSVNSGYREFYILLDDGQSLSEYRLTREYLEKTITIRPCPKIMFYSQIDSKIVGAMQIASLCVSAVRYLYETKSSDKNVNSCNKIIATLTKLNSNTPLNFNPKAPKWNLSRKFSHGLFDPLLKRPEFKKDFGIS